MRNLVILLFTIILLPTLSSAQKWKRNRVEYSFGIGATNFLGDLGGADQVGTNGLRDFELSMTRMGGVLGYRYQLGEDWFVRGNFNYVMVAGDDALTKEPARNSRKLSFRSHILELSAQGEYMLVKQKSGHLYRLRGVRGKSWFRFEVYVFGGIGGIAIGFAAQSIRHDIGLAGLIIESHIIVFYQFQPSPLSQVQIRLGEEIF